MTGSMLNERSRSSRIVLRCRSSAELSTRSASSRRSAPSESITASSMRLIPESDCTGPSWRNSANRRRSSCSAVISWSDSRARSDSRTCASASSRAFSTARDAKSAKSWARACSSRSKGFERTRRSTPISSSRIRSGKTPSPCVGSPGASSDALAPKSFFASRSVRSSTSFGSSVPVIRPSERTSDSSSPSTTSCRRRSVTIRWSAKPAAPTIAPARPTNASQPDPAASPISETTAARATIATSRDALVDDRFAKRNRDGMRSRVCLELGEDVAHVALHRLLADEEPAGDVRVRHAVGEELEDLPLAGGEHLLLAAGQEGRHQRRIDEALAGHDLVDRLQQGLVRSLLEDVALRAGLEPAPQELPLAVGREDQHRDVGDLL